MARHVLDFPTIRVPRTDWFVRTLLYRDAVGATEVNELLPKSFNPETISGHFPSSAGEEEACARAVTIDAT